MSSVPSPFDLVKDTPFAAYTAGMSQLTGGMVNHVWRLSDANGQTVIVKYAAAAMSMFPTIKVSTERMCFEARGLALLNGPTRPVAPCIAESAELQGLMHLGCELTETPGVYVPRLLHYDAAVPFVVLEDVGQLLPYDSWYSPGQPLPAKEMLTLVSTRVGEWLARLHIFGYRHIGKLAQDNLLVNKPARSFLGDVFFQTLCQRIPSHAVFQNSDSCADLLAAVREFRTQVADETSNVHKTVLFGDLWSGSILFDQQALRVNILDLEFIDTGLIYSDVGHLMAHLLPVHFLAEHKYDPLRDACPEHALAFLKSYRSTLGECPEALEALVTSKTVLQCARFFGMEVARDVLTGYWCRCGKSEGFADAEKSLTCQCAETLLSFASQYILNTTGTQNVFDVLLN
ncbi:hypothetical protein GGI07_005392 [Coemansia sp. Benny D115]|nr:hypothetical protein GGI07_005392 [Coemansia sp. Benny D115]